MNCEKYQELISCLIDGEITPEERAELEKHIASCPECKAMYEDFSALSDMMDDSMAQVPDSLHEKIMSGVKSTAAKKSKKPLIIRLRPYMAAAACLVVAVGAVFAARNGVSLDTAANSTAAAAPGAASYGYASGTMEDTTADCAIPADTPAEAPKESTESYFSGSDMADSNAGAEAPRSEEPVTNEPEASYEIDAAPGDIQLSFAHMESARLTTFMTDGSSKTVAITDLQALSEALEPMDFYEELDFNTSALLELVCGGQVCTLELYYAGEALIVRHGDEYWFAVVSVQEFLDIK